MGNSPEAHCYQLLHGKRIDITFPTSDIAQIESDILAEIEIQPHQVGDYKVQFHREFLAKWIAEHLPERDLDQIWDIREKGIRALAG